MRFLSTAIIAVLILAQGASAQGRNNCAPRDQIIERLSERYGETRRAVGLNANQTMMELFASSESGSWSITITMPNGMSCLVAAGKAFESVTDPLLPTGQKI